MRNKRALLIYSITHMIVDFTCFYIIMGDFTRETIKLETIALGILTYNIIAFGFQMFIGFIVDNYINYRKSAITGCILVAIAVILPNMAWVSLILCALGNAFFHIGGGVESLVF